MIHQTLGCRLCFPGLCAFTLIAGAQLPDVSNIPPHPRPQLMAQNSGQTPNFEPNQTIRRTVPTLNEEATRVLDQFRAAYSRANSPRILVLFNRDLEDNDSETMVKTGKVQGGVSTITESGSNSERTRSEGGITTFAPAAPAANSYSSDELERIRTTFEQPLIEGGVHLIDRETAVRLHGISNEEIFAYQDLPEAKRSQVTALKKYADLLVVVKTERSTATVRKVSGDYQVDAPLLLVRAIQLSDARILVSTSSSYLANVNAADTTYRTALSLMEQLSNHWSSR